MLKILDITMNCMKCGDCQAVCPTFAVTGDESAVARGRIRLIKAFEDGELELTDALVDKINSCMMCMACTASCPSGVNVGELILSARKKIVEEMGLPASKRIGIEALKHPAFISPGLRLATLCRPFLGDVIPKGPGRTFSGSHVSKPGNSKMRAALFVGCMVNYVHPEIGDAALNVLAENGIGVLLKEEVCCGVPALYSGDEKTARQLAKANVEQFSKLDVDAIVTCCPTCETVIKGYPALLENDERAVEVADKICNISSFLAKSGFKSGRIEERVAYHEPCHLKYGAGMEDDLKIISSV